MGTSVYTSLLIKDYKRKKGEIKALRKDLRELAKVVLAKEREAAAIATIIQAREPEIDVTNFKAIATQPKVLGLKRNTLTFTILSCLREAEGEIVPSDFITDYVIEQNDLGTPDRAQLIVLRRSVKDRLKALARDGRVVRHHDHKSNGFGLWSLPGGK